MRAHYQASISRGIGTPEANLWASVLHSAMLEGFFGCPGGHYATLAANSQAITFLVAERGEWADSRRRICAFLGIEDAIFTRLCRTVFEGGPVPPEPGFGTRPEKDLEKQRALYRALMIEAPAPPVKRPEPPKPVAPPKSVAPKPVKPKPEPLTNAMAKAIFAVMSQPRPTTPIEVNVDGLLYWPVKASETGTFKGMPLPVEGTKQYRVMRMATRQRGGNLIGLHQCGGDWEDTLRVVAAHYDLELVHGDCRPVTEMTGETRLFLRQRPSPSP